MRTYIIVLSAVLFIMPAFLTAELRAQEFEPIRKREKKEPNEFATSQLAMIKHVLPRIQQRKTSWQFYQSYKKMMDEAAELLRAVEPRSKAAGERQEKWIAWCRHIGDLFMQLEQPKKVMDEIRLRNSTIPLEQQRQAYDQADKEFQNVLRRLELSLKGIPDGLEKTLETLYRRSKTAAGTAPPASATEQPAPAPADRR